MAATDVTADKQCIGFLFKIEKAVRKTYNAKNKYKNTLVFKILSAIVLIINKIYYWVHVRPP